MDSTVTVSPWQLNTDDTSKEDLDLLERELAVVEDVLKVQELAQYIDAEGTPEMKAKLKPFKEHYDGDIATLLVRRTKQNFDNDLWTEVSQKGEEEKAKFRKDPEAYLNAEDKEARMLTAYDKTVEEAKKLAANLQQTIDAAKARSASTAPSGRRLMFGGASR